MKYKSVFKESLKVKVGTTATQTEDLYQIMGEEASRWDGELLSKKMYDSLAFIYSKKGTIWTSLDTSAIESATWENDEGGTMNLKEKWIKITKL